MMQFRIQSFLLHGTISVVTFSQSLLMVKCDGDIKMSPTHVNANSKLVFSSIKDYSRFWLLDRVSSNFVCSN